jgi:phage terminase large subunit-like protein
VECDPRIAVVPDRVRHAGPQITRVAAMAGLGLDEAQRFVAEAVSGTGPDGKWAAFEAVVFTPRQNLKTEFLIARILAGLFVFGEGYIVYSAHQVKTTSKTFRRLRRAIERNARLGGRIARVSNRIGAETIELASGQVVEMVARSTNSGRGFTGDTILLDESHELDGDQLAAILPMLSTRPNPQVIYALSLGNEHSSHLGGLRERALDGRQGVCWIEWSLADDDDVADRRVWQATNPAFHAGRISMEYMEREFEALGPDRFARERLGRSEWPTGDAGDWLTISADAWSACLAPAASVGEVPVLAAVSESAAGPEVSPVWESWPGTVPPWVVRREPAFHTRIP